MMRHAASVVAIAAVLTVGGGRALAQSSGDATSVEAPGESHHPTDYAGNEKVAGGHDMAMPAGLGALQIRGFNDIDYHVAQGGGTPNTFSVGQLDLFLSSRLNATLNVVSEFVVEAGSDNAVGVDLERMLVQYSPSDYFTIAAGRFHTAIGYYNAAYHHGNWFQTAVGRPFVYRFEDDGGILPVHGVGLTAQGQIPSGLLGLRYVVELSNGRRSRSATGEAVQSVSDENGRKAVNVGLTARPAWLPGLQAGVSIYRDRLVPAGRAPVGETIAVAHVVYETPAFEALNEVIVMRHSPEDGGAALSTTSVYSQVSPRIGRAHPFVRFEYLDVPAAERDALLASYAGRSYGPSAGIRVDVADAVAMKVQWDHLTGPVRNATNGVTAQVAFTF